MTEQPTNPEIPTTCKECYDGKIFKRPTPDCSYEKAYNLKELLKLFKNDFKLDLEVEGGLNANPIFAKLHPEAMLCLIDTKKNAESTLVLKKVNEMCDKLSHMNDDIEELKNNREELREDFNTKIFSKNESAMDSPEHEVKKETIVVEKDTKHPKGGWKRYQRNVLEANLKKYLKKMKEFRPSLVSEIDLVLNGKHSDFIKLEFNKRKNYMISFRDIT